ncbi:hypothetical protein CEP53_013469 [Fusarium sp. AF-6]|nr:hypothetical protein CEP53_013469 [Fusarium sp. AF-6]
MLGKDLGDAAIRTIKAQWKEEADMVNQAILDSHEKKIGQFWDKLKALHEEEARQSIFGGVLALTSYPYKGEESRNFTRIGLFLLAFLLPTGGCSRRLIPICIGSERLNLSRSI